MVGISVMQTKQINNNAALEAGQFIIFSDRRGDYITNIKADGEIMGGSAEDAIRYTAEEAQEVIEYLGRGYGIENTLEIGN